MTFPTTFIILTILTIPTIYISSCWSKISSRVSTNLQLIFYHVPHHEEDSAEPQAEDDHAHHPLSRVHLIPTLTWSLIQAQCYSCFFVWITGDGNSNFLSICLLNLSLLPTIKAELLVKLVPSFSYQHIPLFSTTRKVKVLPWHHNKCQGYRLVGGVWPYFRNILRAPQAYLREAKYGFVLYISRWLNTGFTLSPVCVCLSFSSDWLNLFLAVVLPPHILYSCFELGWAVQHSG